MPSAVNGYLSFGEIPWAWQHPAALHGREGSSGGRLLGDDENGGDEEQR